MTSVNRPLLSGQPGENTRTMEDQGEYPENEADGTKHNENAAFRPGKHQVYNDVSDLNPSMNSVPAGQEFQSPVVVYTGVLEFIIICFFASIEVYYPLIQQYVYGRLLGEHSHDAGQGEMQSWTAHNSSDRTVCFNTSTSAQEERAQKDSSKWLLYIGLSNVIPGIFSTLILGSITDFKGRKLGMLIPSVGAIIRIGITMLVIKYNWPLYVLLICGFIDGCLGSFGTVFTAAFAYLADITEPGKQRTWRITVIQALMAIISSGVSVGVGYFIKACGFFYPMVLSIGLLVLDIIIIILFLPETIRSRRNVPILSMGRLVKSVSIYLEPREGTRRLRMGLLMLSNIVIQMVLISKGVVGTLFQMGMPFCWRSVKLGIYSGVGTTIQTSSMLILLRPLTRCMHENIVCMIGIISTMGELTMFGLAITDVMLFLAPVAGFFLQIPSAMIKSVLSEMVDDKDQGSLFAGLCSVQLLCYSFGASIFTTLYVQTVSSFPGLVFLVMAGVISIAFVLTGIVEFFRRKDVTRSGYQRFPCHVEIDP